MDKPVADDRIYDQFGKQPVARGRIYDEHGKCNAPGNQLDKPKVRYYPDLKIIQVRVDDKRNLPFWLEIDLPESYLRALLHEEASSSSSDDD